MTQPVDAWPPRYHQPESDVVLDYVGSKTQVHRDVVDSIVADLRHVIDGFVSDDYTVVASPLVFARPGDPVWQALHDRLVDPHWTSPPDHEGLDDAQLGALLGLDEQVVTDYPLIWEIDLLIEVWAMRGIARKAIVGGDQEALAAAESVKEVVDAWLDASRGPNPLLRQYYLSRVGLESTFGAWLVADLGRLADFGFPVELVRQEHRFTSGHRADVVCRVTEDRDDLRKGDWLVVENKAHMADLPAYEQLAGYLTSARQELAQTGQRVHGLLLADGVTVQLQERLRQEGVHYLSLSSLGYRDYLRGAPADLLAANGPDALREQQAAAAAPVFPRVQVPRQQAGASMGIQPGPVQDSPTSASP